MKKHFSCTVKRWYKCVIKVIVFIRHLQISLVGFSPAELTSGQLTDTFHLHVSRKHQERRSCSFSLVSPGVCVGLSWGCRHILITSESKSKTTSDWTSLTSQCQEKSHISWCSSAICPLDGPYWPSNYQMSLRSWAGPFTLFLCVHLIWGWHHILITSESVSN